MHARSPHVRADAAPHTRPHAQYRTGGGSGGGQAARGGGLAGGYQGTSAAPSSSTRSNVPSGMIMNARPSGSGPRLATLRRSPEYLGMRPG